MHNEVFLKLEVKTCYNVFSSQLPELNAVTDQNEFNMRKSLKIFVIQNAGLLSGYGIMILLAVYGEHIQI